MSVERSLPRKRNPLLAPDKTPEYSELVATRRLGSTSLRVKTGHVGNSNATRAENLGSFDYVHLKAPLPENLKSSEIFTPGPNLQRHEAYFLMRRCSDGLVSATGMFKSAFPWSKAADERSERDYLRTLPTTAKDDTAGNVWISEASALELGSEYGIRPWVEALLDPAPVATDNNSTSIIPPPPFTFTANGRGSLPPPPTLPPASRPRGRRAGSPSKTSSPRKPRLTKAWKEATAAMNKQANESLQSSLEQAALAGEATMGTDGDSVVESETNGEYAQSITGSVLKNEESVNGDKEYQASNGKLMSSPNVAHNVFSSVIGDSEADEAEFEEAKYDSSSVSNDKVTVEVEQAIEVKGDIETTTTNVKVEMPVGSQDLPLPESTEDMIARAKEMVEEARKLDGEALAAASSSSSGKRKFVELDVDDEGDVEKDSQLQPAKKARILEQEVRKERVRNRALFGAAVTMAIGAAIPFLWG